MTPFRVHISTYYRPHYGPHYRDGIHNLCTPYGGLWRQRVYPYLSMDGPIMDPLMDPLLGVLKGVPIVVPGYSPHIPDMSYYAPI